MVDEGGELIDEQTEIIRHKWFRDFIHHAWDSILYGYSLIQFGDIVDDVFLDVQSVDRMHVIPERRTVTLSGVVGTSEVPIDEDPYAQTLLYVGNDDFGILNQATPMALWKKLAFNAWAEYTDIYGIPPVIGKTDGNDKESKDQLQKMLANFRSSTYGIFDHDDEIEVPDLSNSTPGAHREFINSLNAELSKLIIGQTMTTEDGSSRSQSETHMQVMKMYEQADLQFIKDVVNLKLLPFLRDKGLISDNVRFEWDLEETMTAEQKKEMYETLLPHYNISPETVEQDLGIEVDSIKSSPQQSLNKVMNRSFSDYPKSVKALVKRALDFAVQNKKGTAKQKRLARRIIKGEGLGRNALMEIASYKRFARVKNNKWEKSNGALAFCLVGGEKMVEDFAPRKLQELKQNNHVHSKVMEDVSALYGIHESGNS